MVKKVLIFFFFSFVMICNVYVDSYYENALGVHMSEEEYNFIKEFYNEYYPSVITQERYDNMKEQNIFGQEIITVSSDDQSAPNAFIETPYKRLSTTYSCGDDECLISATLKWLKKPATKSYDLFGSYLYNTGEIYDISSWMYKNGSPINPVEYKINSIGVAATHKLPTSFDTLSFDFSFMVPKQGRIYLSYQHATESISLVDSRKYNFAFSGYGNVFDFSESIRPYYDDMSGIAIRF